MRTGPLRHRAERDAPILKARRNVRGSDSPESNGAPRVSRSLWLDQALAAEPPARSEAVAGDIRADVCVVGGGLTGLWTALRISELEPSLSVVLIEADLCGAGASGRNGGFVMSWWSKFGTLEKVCGSEEARRLAHASVDAIRETGEFCTKHGVSAQFRQAGWLWAATSETQQGAWASVSEDAERQGERPFELLSREEVVDLTGSATHIGGVVERDAAVVHPGFLVRGLRRVALDRGVRIFERSPMTGLVPGVQPQVETPSGRVIVDRVVLALNAWTAPLREFRPWLVVVASDVIATEQIPARLEEIGWKPGLAISDSRRLVNYYRCTDDGRIVFGKGGGTIAFRGRVGRAFDGVSPRRSQVLEHMHRAYPMLADVDAESSWRGPIDYAAGGLPAFLRLESRGNVVAGAGYSGNGVGPSLIGAKILASLALDHDDEWSTCGLTKPPSSRLPVEPFRFVGGSLVRAAFARKESIEDRGGRPGPLVRALAGLDPTSFVEVSR